jgi:hypothetical protein
MLGGPSGVRGHTPVAGVFGQGRWREKRNREGQRADRREEKWKRPERGNTLNIGRQRGREIEIVL